jgi:hypothetical protein
MDRGQGGAVVRHLGTVSSGTTASTETGQGGYDGSGPRLGQARHRPGGSVLW